MNLQKGIAIGAVVILTKEAVDSETRTRVSRQQPRWWRELGHLWTTRAWESQAPVWARGIVWSAARECGVPAEVIAAVIHVESRWRADAVSAAGAIGLMQLMPSTAASLGVDPWDPGQNARGGARYLRAMLDHFGSTAVALAAYNAGPSRAARPPATWPSETTAYVASVLHRIQASPEARLPFKNVVASHYGQRVRGPQPGPT